jgi:Ribosome biogenesis protein SLX9
MKKEMMSDLSVFQQVLAHPEYTKDPFKTISTHIENKMLLEAMQTNQ